MSAAFPLTPDDGDTGAEPARTRDSDLWLGSPGAQIRLTGRVERITPGTGGVKRYQILDEATGAAVEWVSPRRYRIEVGDRLQMSGVVRRHTTAGSNRVTVLHHCFNPMRLS